MLSSSKSVHCILVFKVSSELLKHLLCFEGFDSCPMEGFDEKRIKKILKLNWQSHVVMIFGIGEARKLLLEIVFNTSEISNLFFSCK